MSGAKRSGIKLSFLCSVAIYVILISCGLSFMLTLITELHTNGERRRCTSKLSIILDRLHQYEKDFQQLPSSVLTEGPGSSPYSWRLALQTVSDPNAKFGVWTPYGYKISEPWDGPNNSKLHQQVVGWLHCEADPGPRTDTSYVAVVGPDTAFSGAKKLKIEEFKGGLLNTVLLIETHNSGIHWMEPRDWTIDEAVLKINSSGAKFLDGHHGNWLRHGSPYALYADGTIRAMNPNVEPKILRHLLSVTDETKLNNSVMYPEIQQPR